ncbi:hypothetical protein LSAT2_028380 [Lamellibrachia satsuma]|nr:hypothetical protein LSAT2_028380 [Lamellibrachia satsuma]
MTVHSICVFQNNIQKEIQNEIWSAVSKWQREADVASDHRHAPMLLLDSTNHDSGISSSTSCNGFGSSHHSKDTRSTSCSSLDKPFSLVPNNSCAVLSTYCPSDGSVHEKEARMVRSISSCSNMEESASKETGETGCLARWGSSLSLTENRSWSRSNRNDMMKSFKPDRISKIFLKGVTTTEEVI